MGSIVIALLYEIRDWWRKRRRPDLESEYGRLLAERDRLIAEGVDPADLEIPLPPRRR